MKYSSIIYIKGGIVTLTNVDFYNIVAYENNAVILSDQTSNIPTFTYQGGTISFINNGFELNYQPLSSFMSLYSITNVTLKDLIFKFNIVSKSGSSLIHLNYFRYVSIKNCEFEYNFVNSEKLIQFKNDKDWMFNDNDDEVNVEISHCTVKNNTAGFVFLFEYDDSCQNIWVHDNLYEFNLVKSVLSVEKNKDPSLTCIYGDDDFTASFLILEAEEYTSNKVESLIWLGGLSNIELDNLKITETLLEITSEFTTFNSLRAEPGAYLKSSVSSKVISSSLIYLKNCIFVSIDSLSASSIYTSLIITKLSSHLLVKNVSISDTQVNDDLISIEIKDDLTLSDIFFNNTYIGEGSNLVYVDAYYTFVTASISNVELDSFSGSFYFESVHYIHLINIKAVNSGNMEQALIYVWFSSNASFSLTYSEFYNNLCSVLKIEGDSKSEALINLNDLVFSENSAYSPLVQIVSPISLSPESYFENLVFEFNSNTAIDVSSLGGNLQIESSDFRNNSSIGSIVSVKGTTVVEVSHCEFIGNKGFCIVNIELSSFNSHLQTSFCSFVDNTGITVYLQDSSYRDLGSTYTLNTASYGPVIHATGSNIYIINSIIANNRADMHGALYLSWKTYLSGTNISFTSNEALNKGGAMFIEQDSTVSLDSCTFESNLARIGSAIFMQHTSSASSQITNTSFAFNFATLSSCIYLLESQIKLMSCQVSNNEGLLVPSLTAIFSSSVHIENSQFLGHNGLGGGHLSIQFQSACLVYNTTFGKSFADYGASAVNVETSSFQCISCIFEDYFVDVGYCVICRES